MRFYLVIPQEDAEARAMLERLRRARVPNAEALAAQWGNAAAFMTPLLEAAFAAHDAPPDAADDLREYLATRFFYQNRGTP